VESISGEFVPPIPTPTQLVSFEIFTETDDTNPLHINYDFTKSEPLSIIEEEDIITKKTNTIRHYKLKKDDTNPNSGNY